MPWGDVVARRVNILGIDPGFASVGYAVVSFEPDHNYVGVMRSGGTQVPVMGTIRTEKSDKKRSVKASDDNLRRGREIHSALSFLMGPKPDTHPAIPFKFGGEPLNIQAVCVESMSFPRSASTAQKIGITWGIISAVSGWFDVPIVQASPQEIKKQVCGAKNASKENVQETLAGRFDIDLVLFPKTLREHPFDALGAVIACQDSEVIRMALKMAAA
jgi:Holliday junction resolvasome RuvABC endonuclease subunit